MGKFVIEFVDKLTFPNCCQCKHQATVEVTRRGKVSYWCATHFKELQEDMAAIANPPTCEQCKEAVGEFYTDGVWMCIGCHDDYRSDHPDPEELAARAEYFRESKEDR